MKSELGLALLLTIVSCSAFAQTYNPTTADTLPTVTINNGIVSIEANGDGGSNTPYFHFPGITKFSVLGNTIVPFDNSGANFQMSIRSNTGDAYNPTLEGDCHNNPSQLNAMLFQQRSGSYTGNWVPAGSANPATNGVLMGVTPLQFVSSNGQCSSQGILTPYYMNFGISAGDGAAMPPQGMLLEMQVRKTDASAQDIVKGLSELPTIYGKLNALQYAFYSTDLATFQPASAYFPVGCTIGGSLPCNSPTNNIVQWPIAGNSTAGYFVQTDLNISVTSPTPIYYGTNLPAVRILMLCNSEAISATGALQMTTGVCLALYSETPAAIGLSRRLGAEPLSSMGMVGAVSTTSTITDTNWHTLRRLVIVGNPGTVLAVVSQSRKYVDGYSASW